jgi:hypothetical protein
MAAPDRASLTADATAYLHRADLPWDDLIDQANARIGRDFRVLENTVTYTTTSQVPVLLPADFSEVIQVSTNWAGVTMPLAPLGPEKALEMASSNGRPYGYTTNNGYLTPIPASNGFTLLYYAELTLGALNNAQPGDTNALLTAYPQAYLWYVLMLGNLFIQANEQVVIYAGLYADELQRVNDIGRQRSQPISRAAVTTGVAVVAT